MRDDEPSEYSEWYKVDDFELFFSTMFTKLNLLYLDSEQSNECIDFTMYVFYFSCHRLFTQNQLSLKRRFCISKFVLVKNN